MTKIQFTEYKGLKNVDWDIPKGISVLVGPNGGGKTRLLKSPNELLYYGSYAISKAKRGSLLLASTQLMSDGSNLSAVLNNWWQKGWLKDRFDWICKVVGECYPHFDGLAFDTSADPLQVEGFYKDTRSTELSPFEGAPGSMIAMMMHMCAIAGAAPQSVVAIDPFDHHFHPETTRILLTAIKEYIEDVLDVSVVLTTQSNVVLNWINTDYERVFIVDERMPTNPMPLLRIRKAEWLHHFQLGELYQHEEFGGTQPLEDWETE